MSSDAQRQNPSVRGLLMRPFMAGMALLLLLIGVSLYGQYTVFLGREAKAHRQAVLTLYQRGINEHRISLGILLEGVSSNPFLREALARRDSVRLQSLFRASFNELSARYGIASLVFADSQRYAVTRMRRQRERDNERVDHFTMREAERTGKAVSGFDLAHWGDLSMHMAAPVFDRGVLVGYVEAAMGLDAFLADIARADKAELIFFLNKDMVDRDSWERGARARDRRISAWDEFPSKVEVFSTLQGNAAELERQLLALPPDAETAQTELSHGTTSYTVNRVSLADSLGTVTGDLFILEDSSALRFEYFAAAAVLIAAALLVIAASRALASKKLRDTDTLISGMLARLQEGDAVLRNVFEESETGFVLQNWITGEVLRANKVALNIFGCGDAAGINFSELRPLPPEDERQRIWQSSGAGTPLMSIRSAVTTRYCAISRFFTGTDDETECVAIRDVTRVVDLQLERQEQIEHLQTIIDQLPGMVFIKDSELRLLMYNAYFDRIFGDGQSMLGRVRFAEWPGMNLDGMLEADHIALESGEVCTFEVSMTLRDGRDYTYVISKQALRGKDGSKQLLCVSTDITERSRMEKQLVALREKAEAANRAKSQFLARMSHEIRTPMNAVIGMSHLALAADPDPRQRNYLTKIHDAARNLLGIINDILDFSKIEAGEMTIERIPFSLPKVIADLSAVTQPLIANKPVRLSFSLPENMPDELVGDPLRLRQVLLNLVNNAVKFTAEGEVRLSCSVKEARDDGLTLHFAVEDTGIGIPENALQRLFTSFQQVDGSITRKYGGSGLGLAISRQLVSLMGGGISVRSAPGKGSCFFFFLPFGKNTNAAGECSAPASEPAGGPAEAARPRPGLHVLVVEDNAINQEIIVELLREYGAQTVTADNGEEAVKAVCGACFDMVLMDLQMPVMDGLEATRIIRSMPGKEKDSLPIIALTANAMLEDRDLCLASGMNDFLSKPIDVDELCARICLWSDGAA